jgi:hypothetical protein
MFSEAECRQRIARFVSGDVSLDDFEDWFVSASWNQHQHAGAGLQRLVGLVELLLAEHSGGHRSEHQLRASLHSLLVPHQQTSNAPQADVQAFSEPQIRFRPIVQFASNAPVPSVAGVSSTNSSVAEDEPEIVLDAV